MKRLSRLHVPRNPASLRHVEDLVRVDVDGPVVLSLDGDEWASSFAPDVSRNPAKFARALLKMRPINPLRQMWDSKAVVGLMLPTIWDDRGTFGSLLEPLLELIRGGTITPLIDASFPLAQAADAHRRLAERKNIGKVVLVPA